MKLGFYHTLAAHLHSRCMRRSSLSECLTQFNNIVGKVKSVYGIIATQLVRPSSPILAYQPSPSQPVHESSLPLLFYAPSLASGHIPKASCYYNTSHSEGGQLLPGSVIRHYRRGHLGLPGVLPGVTWALPGVTWALPDTCVFILE